MVGQRAVMLDPETQARFIRLWADGVRLADIADQLSRSWHSLAKERMTLGLPKRYGNYDDDGETPTPAVIKLRCQAEQTNWTETERRLRWRGPPHTIYQSTTTCDFQP
jgi:hypothetical protein